MFSFTKNKVLKRLISLFIVAVWFYYKGRLSSNICIISIENRIKTVAFCFLLLEVGARVAPRMYYTLSVVLQITQRRFPLTPSKYFKAYILAIFKPNSLYRPGILICLVSEKYGLEWGIFFLNIRTGFFTNNPLACILLDIPSISTPNFTCLFFFFKIKLEICWFFWKGKVSKPKWYSLDENRSWRTFNRDKKF